MRVRDGDPVPSEWVVEYDLDTCTQIRARGQGVAGVVLEGVRTLSSLPDIRLDLTASYNYGTDDGLNAQTSGTTQSEYRYQGWMTAMANFNQSVFRYSLNPDCIYWSHITDNELWESAGSYDISDNGPPDVGILYDACYDNDVENHGMGLFLVTPNDGSFCAEEGVQFEVYLDDHVSLTFSQGILYRDYFHDNQDNFAQCPGNAGYDFQYYVGPEDPASGPVSKLSPPPIAINR